LQRSAFNAPSLQNLIKIVPGYIAALPILSKCNLESNPIEHLDPVMASTLTRFNLKSSTEMFTENWRHHEQVLLFCCCIHDDDDCAKCTTASCHSAIVSRISALEINS
jgi:hypothetical protein